MKVLKRKHAVIVTLCFMFHFSAACMNAEAEETVFAATTLDVYLRQAQTANPELKAFKARYEAAIQRIPQAASLPEPMLQVTHFVESVQTRTGPQENIFMLSQRIPWFGKLRSREDLASAEAEALWYTYQDRELLLAKTVAVHFFDYGFTGEAITLTAKNLDWLVNLEPIIEEKVRGGGDINPLLRLKVEVGRVADRLASLKQRRRAQSARLNALLALPDDTILPLPTLAPTPPLTFNDDALMDAIDQNNPELQMLSRRIESAEARQEVARLVSYPDLTLGINYIQIGDPAVNPTTPDAGNDPWGITASLKIPLWFDKNKAARAEALAGRLATVKEYEHRANALKADMRASIALLEDATRRLKLYGDELLGLAEQAVENSQASYETGRTGILEVIDSERSLLDLQLLSWRAAADAWKQRVIIQTLANQSLLDLATAENNNE
ncbi:TolC family protein [Desulfogranum mediterraneum]|uniref:TolC family protein n=1 Tax=Desulfogranum mediterraneum TaxID=160661 RepID=UPI0003FF43DD|nr:TolC family protein [Desulfogranum mediterraneum]